MTGLQTTLLGVHLRILSPLWLWLSPLPLLAGLYAALRSARRQARVRGLVPPSRFSAVLSGAGLGQGVARGVLAGAGLALLFVAASGLQAGERTELIKRTGVDLVIALDASTSMLARDVRPSRLDRAKLELGALLERLKGDRVGLVVFAGDAFVQCPLTTDYAAMRLFLRAVEPSAMPRQGTALAAALLESRNVLEAGGRGNAARAVLLLTDGEDQEGDAQTAAQALGDAGIRLYTVPIGSEAGEPIPLFDKAGNVAGYKKDRDGKTVLTRVDAAGLRELAARGNGLMLGSAGPDPGVQLILPELDKLQRGELESRLSVQYDDRYPLVAWPAFVLLFGAALLGEGPLWRRRNGA